MIWRINRLYRYYKFKKSSSYCMANLNLNKIKPVLTMKEIKKIVKKEKYTLTADDWLMNDIKTDIYLYQMKNTVTDIENFLWKKQYDSDKQFEKMFWKEYVYQYEISSRIQYNHKDYEENVKELNKIKKYLDKHPKLHGLTGNGLQNLGHRLGKMEMNYTWRAWGSINVCLYE